MSSQLTPPQLKKALIASGFEVFRTLSDEVVLAERVRENLILDSGVRLGPIDGGNGGFRVRVVFRAQRTDFPAEEEAALFERVRRLAEPAVAAGFAEHGSNVNLVKDPVDVDRVLDTFYEVSLVQIVPTLDDALPVVRFALSLEKTVGAH